MTVMFDYICYKYPYRQKVWTHVDKGEQMYKSRRAVVGVCTECELQVNVCTHGSNFVFKLHINLDIQNLTCSMLLNIRDIKFVKRTAQLRKKVVTFIFEKKCSPDDLVLTLLFSTVKYSIKHIFNT